MLVQKYIRGTTTVNIAASVEEAVSAGRLPAGMQLPPVRTLASQLEVSPATVAAAYRTLQDRGVVISDGRRGTRVRSAPPISMPAEARVPEGVRDLAGGNPDPRLLPNLAAAMKRVTFEQRVYGEELNDPDLLALARESFASDSVPAANLSIVSGALDGI